MNEAINKKIKKWDRIAVLVSIVVFVIVSLTRRYKIYIDLDLSFLAGVNAALNSITTLLLLVALYFIKQGNKRQHQRMMTYAFIISFFFILVYLVYHFTTAETEYCKEGISRSIYYFVLITHIILAGLSLPFILFTYIRAWFGAFDRHRSLAKKVYPFWLYVSITGPIVYLMLKPCYV